MSGRSDENALQDLQQRFTAFTNACAHDLRTPARNIGALCELLSESGAWDRLSDREKTLVDCVISESKRMNAILDGVVTYARVPVRAAHGTVDLGRLVDAHWMHPKEDLTLDVLPKIDGETKLVATLVGELVSNVVRFAGDGPPRLHVFCEQHDGYVDIHFADQGVGIPEGREEAIFAVLRRCHPDGGVGSGLAVCERIAAAHGGSMRVVHGRTDGATVVVRFPERLGPHSSGHSRT